MKTIKYLIIGAALMLGACTQNAIDDLTGLYQPPTPCEFTTASDIGTEKVSGKRIFNVAMTNASGDCLEVKFVGDKYFLHSAAYTPGKAEDMKTGTYIVGAEGSTFTSANGQPTFLDRGQIVLSKTEDTYKLSGNIWLADSRVIRLAGTFTLIYEPDPEPVSLSKVLSVTNNVPNGTNSVSLQLATAGVESSFDPATWSTTYTGSGNYLAADFYSADGTLAPGVYTPAASDELEPFTYARGWDPGDLWGIGMVFTNWGTCWWTVDNGITSAVHLEDGNIEVAQSGSTYTITYNHGGVFFEFRGAIEGLGGAPIEYLELSKMLGVTNNVPNGTNTVTVKLGTSGITAKPNAWGGVDMDGDGNYIAIDFYSTDGTVAPGLYTAADSNEMGAMNFGKGWDPGDLWGIGMEFFNWGTCWFTRTDGTETGAHITDGTISVAVEGEVYTITVESGEINAQYTGTL